MHATSPDRVKSLVRFCLLLWCVALSPLGSVSPGSPTTAEQLFQQAQKAERRRTTRYAYLFIRRGRRPPIQNNLRIGSALKLCAPWPAF